MRVINVISEPGRTLPPHALNYSYKQIKYYLSEDSYLYEFKYLSSGLKLILVLNSSETLWLRAGKEYLEKFETELDKAMKLYMKNIEYIYKRERKGT